MNNNYSKRIRLIFGIFFLITIIIIFKLFWVQIIKGESYLEKSESQYSRILGANYDRGSIFFESKDGVRSVQQQ